MMFACSKPFGLFQGPWLPAFDELPGQGFGPLVCLAQVTAAQDVASANRRSVLSAMWRRPVQPPVQVVPISALVLVVARTWTKNYLSLGRFDRAAQATRKNVRASSGSGRLPGPRRDGLHGHGGGDFNPPAAPPMPSHTRNRAPFSPKQKSRVEISGEGLFHMGEVHHEEVVLVVLTQLAHVGSCHRP